MYDAFVAAVLKKIDLFYAEDPKNCLAFGRLVSSKHLKRVVGYLQTTTGRVLAGGDFDDGAGHYVAPTVVEVSKEDDVLMKEEIFGPILPLYRVKSTEESVRLVLKGEKPLAMYIFCQDQAVVNSILDKTQSGSVGVNETILQLTGEHTFLGGVGESGMGRYGLEFGFDTFSHQKPVLHSTPKAASKQRRLDPDQYSQGGWLWDVLVRIFLHIPLRGSGGVPWLEKMGRLVRLVASVVVACVAIVVGTRVVARNCDLNKW